MTLEEFVLKFTLDAGQFTKGASEIKEAVDKTKDAVVDSGNKIEKALADIGKHMQETAENTKKFNEIAEKSHKNTENAAKGGAEQLSKMAREALGLFGIYASASGIKNFTQDITASDAALGRQSANIAIASEKLAAWGIAAKMAGGSAETTQASIASFYHKLWGVKFNAEELPATYLRLLSEGHVDWNPDDNIETQVNKFARAMRNREREVGRPYISEMAGRAGFDQTMVNVILGHKDLDAYLKSLQPFGPTQNQTEKAEKLQAAMGKLDATFEALGRSIINPLMPALSGLLDKITSWAEKNKDFFDKVTLVNPLTGEGIPTKDGSKRAPSNGWLGRNWDALNKWYWKGTIYDEGTQSGGSAEAKWQRMRRILGGGEPSGITTDPLLGSIADAVQKQEGFYPGSRSYRNNNPGNIKLGSFAKQFGATEADNQGHAIFPDYASGRAALEALLSKHSGESLSKMGGWYAEDPNWARGVSAAGGLDINAPMNFGAATAQNARGYAQYQARNGAGFAAMNSSTSNISNSSADTNVHGDIHITLPGISDANGFASALPGVLNSAIYANAFNGGPQ